MSAIDITTLHEMLSSVFSSDLVMRIQMRNLGASGLSITIDGPKCLTSTGIWPNGSCDVDYLFVEMEQGKFNHHEFSCIEDAFSLILREVNVAAERSL